LIAFGRNIQKAQAEQ